MKFNYLVQKIVLGHTPHCSDCPQPSIQDTVEVAVRATIEALGYQVAVDGTIVQLAIGEWQPPGGLDRPKRYPGRRRR